MLLFVVEYYNYFYTRKPTVFDNYETKMYSIIIFHSSFSKHVLNNTYQWRPNVVA